MRRRWIAVARPRTWRGALVGAASLVAWGLLGLIILLVDLPAWTLGDLWIDPVWSRLGLGCLWYLTARAVVPLAFSILSSAPLLWGDWVRVQVRGRRFRIHVRDLERIEIEARPRGEVAVLHLRSGLRLDLCPLRWQGAAPLVASVRVALARSRARSRPRAPVPATEGEASPSHDG